VLILGFILSYSFDSGFHGNESPISNFVAVVGVRCGIICPQKNLSYA
jgi:hypothetical protein